MQNVHVLQSATQEEKGSPPGECQGLDEVPTFDNFWSVYPKRVARKDAEKAWDRLSAEERVAAFVGAVTWLPIWRTMDVAYIPHPATWIHGERWNDELPAAVVVSAACHAPASLPDPLGPRVPIPDHVRQLLAKLWRGEKI